MKYLSQDISLRLDINRCIGCGMCEIVCPHGVFVVEGKKVRILDREACIECGACALNCPVDALDVASGVGCAEAIINGLLTGKETCCVEQECCGSANPPRTGYACEQGASDTEGERECTKLES